MNHQLKTVLITGASGLIGTRLTEILLERGFDVRHLSRSKKGATVPTFAWDIEQQKIEQGALDDVDCIIHLAGANVAEKRWTLKRKKEIIDSRVLSTQLLYNQLSKHGHQVKSFISASAIGYYGFEERDKIFTENDRAGSDFLARVTKLWEEEVGKINQLEIPITKLRIGVVLAKGGGALKPIAKSVNWLAGAPLGSGEQYISWVHIEDVCGIVLHLIERNLSGAYNVVAPQPVTNKQLTTRIARQLHKPMILPAVPAFVLRLGLGEMADIVLEGSKVSADKIISTGYKYRFADLNSALADLLD